MKLFHFFIFIRRAKKQPAKVFQFFFAFVANGFYGHLCNANLSNLPQLLRPLSTFLDQEYNFSPRQL